MELSLHWKAVGLSPIVSINNQQISSLLVQTLPIFNLEGWFGGFFNLTILIKDS